jgi:hypothetical protein
MRLKCDGTQAETRFRLSAKFKSAGESVQSTTGSQGVRISGSNAGYTNIRGSVKSSGYPRHSSVSPSLRQPVRRGMPSRFNWTLQTGSGAGLAQLLKCLAKGWRAEVRVSAGTGISFVSIILGGVWTPPPRVSGVFY